MNRYQCLNESTEAELDYGVTWYSAAGVVIL